MSVVRVVILVCDDVACLASFTGALAETERSVMAAAHAVGWRRSRVRIDPRTGHGIPTSHRCPLHAPFFESVPDRAPSAQEVSPRTPPPRNGDA